MGFFKAKSEEQKLIEACVKGNAKACKTLYDRFSPKMFGICLRYAKDYHVAEDVLQEGFVKIFKNLHKFRFEGSFEGWLRRIIVNTAIEQYRKNVRMYPVGELTMEAHQAYHDMTVENMAAQDLLKLIQELSPGYRTVFNLYVIEGMSHKEISKMMNISEGTSKSQLARARYILQKKVKDLDEQHERVLKKYLDELYV